MKSAFDGMFSDTSTQLSRTLRGSQAWKIRLSLIEKCHSHSKRLKIQIIRFRVKWDASRETDNCSCQTQSRWLMLVVGLFIAVLKLCWATPPDEHSFCQAVCGTFPRCSQWHFRDSATANLRHILSPAETGSLEDHEREPSDDDQDDPLLWDGELFIAVLRFICVELSQLMSTLCVELSVVLFPALSQN